MTPTTATKRLDSTHEPALRSWVEAANDPASDFPIQNLPFGVFRRVGSSEPPRIGVAIGDHVLDVLGCIEEDLLTGIGPETARALSRPTLNHLMSQGADAWSAARRAISRLLETPTAALRDNAALRKRHLVPIDGAELRVPAVSAITAGPARSWPAAPPCVDPRARRRRTTTTLRHSGRVAFWTTSWRWAS
jgi:fumarylacetoacetase